MGMAATQARFLAITSRKTNCEFQSMEIAQQKLSITRDLQRASEDYQSSLNTTKLVWDPDGSGENAFDLSYDMMMKPSAANNYTPYLTTTKDGRIVLDSKMASAARQAGIPEKGIMDKAITLENGTKTTVYNELYGKFLNQMVKNGGMSESSATTCRDIGLIYKVGIGGEMLDKTQASEMGINDLIAYMDATIAAGKYGTTAQKELADALTFKFGSDLKFDTTIKDKGDANQNYFVKNNKRTSNTEFDMTDLLTGDVTFAMTGNANSTKWWKKVLGVIGGALVAPLGGLVGAYFTYGGIKNLLGATKGGMPAGASEQDMALLDFVDNMIDGFAKVLDVDQNDAESMAAFEYAIQETIGLLSQVTDLGSRNHSTDAFDDAVKEANQHNGWVYKAAAKDKNYGTQAISLSNLTESFMTFYAQAQNGYDDTYNIKASSKKSSYVTDDPYYMWTVKNPDANTAQDMYVAEFYSAMFNNICQNGWVEDDQIDDNDYLANNLKNAHYFISSLSNDNYYYQDRYNDNGYVMEVTDESAITQAELEYTNKKSKLNYKEEQLEVNMKRLDLEISSLTTEYDTVKNLISKNVEKTFTMFNS